jgi:spore germination protein GerM
LKSKKKLIVIVGIILVGFGGWVAYYYLSLGEHNLESGIETYRGDIPTKSRKEITHLYFADPDEQFLKAEERVLPIHKTTLDNAGSALEALISGPKGNLSRTIPEGTKLLSIYFTPDKTAYVDFDETITEKHPGGSASELLTIYSIVNTLTLNFSEIDNVKILISGRERKTLAGHIFIQQPFSANLLLIR